MKVLKHQLIVIIIALLGMFSCGYDNYEQPQVVFSGALQDGNTSLQIKAGNVFKLFQYKEDGYIEGGTAGIDIHVNQDGRFSALLFPGRYKMVVNSSGPVYNIHSWNDFPCNENGDLDTLCFEIEKSTSMNFNVTPFYRIENFETYYANDSVYSKFTIRKMIESNDQSVLFRQVAAYLSPTMHINNDTPVYAKKSGVQPDETVLIVQSLKNYYSDSKYLNNYRNYVYVRIGVSLRLDAQETIYSKVIKIDGIPELTIRKLK